MEKFAAEKIDKKDDEKLPNNSEHFSLLAFLIVVLLAALVVLFSMSLLGWLENKDDDLPRWISGVGNNFWTYFASVSSAVFIAALRKVKFEFLHFWIFVSLIVVMIFIIYIFKQLNISKSTTTPTFLSITSPAPISSIKIEEIKEPTGSGEKEGSNDACTGLRDGYRNICNEIKNSNINDLKKFYGELFVVGFEGRNKYDYEQSYLSHLVKNLKLGGFIFYKNNADRSIGDKSDGTKTKFLKFKELTTIIYDESRSANGIAPFLATDAEGGAYSDLAHVGLLTPTPSAMALASTHNISAVKEAADIVSYELKALGLNMNFAPVLDMNIAGDDTVILDRSYSSSNKIVSEMGEAFVKQHSNNDILTVAKHFPGHGGTSSGFHSAGLPESSFNLPSLKTALEPFRSITKKGQTSAVMTSHFLAKGMSEVNVAFDRRVVTDLLQKEADEKFYAGNISGISFKGVVITDDLVSPAVLYWKPKEEGCNKDSDFIVEKLVDISIKSFESGHDILMFSHIVKSDVNLSDILIKRKINGEDFCWRTAITYAEFKEVYDKIFDELFFSGSDEKKERARIKFIGSLLKILTLKNKIRNLRSIDYDEFIRVKHF